MRRIYNRFWFVCMALLLLPCSIVSAHDDDARPKKPTKAVGDLKRARTAMDNLKKRLTQEGNYGCCIGKPLQSKTVGCDLCARTHGSCNCGENLTKGQGVCGECYGGWKSGKGHPAFPKSAAKNLKILPADKQSISPASGLQALPEFKAYQEAMLKAKQTLVAEKRFQCCVGRGGCDECAYESYCGCGPNLLKDINTDTKEGATKTVKKPEKPRGVCSQCVDGQHAGIGRLGKIDLEALVLSTEHDTGMFGALGNYPMQRDGSGTSWLPDRSPQHGHTAQRGGWSLNLSGTGYIAYTDSGGTRGERQAFFPTHLMLHASRASEKEALTFRLMSSLDPLLIGKNGYPLLLQTGETNQGRPLRDRQHPHDLFMEVSGTYSRRFAKDVGGFIYLAAAGDPAIGPSAFPHRPSAWDNPLAPISHHWLDGTHITFGVVTAGLVVGDRWKVEGSVFTGREPNENRYDFDRFRFDSYSGRIGWNPTAEWSFQTSYAYLTNPELLEPGNQHRFTFSAHFERPYLNGDSLSSMFAIGSNIKPERTTTGYLLEAAYRRKKMTYYGRYENIAKDELVDVPEGVYNLQRLSIGGIYRLQKRGGLEEGVGAGIDFNILPQSLKSEYGSLPISFNLFYRLRYGK